MKEFLISGMSCAACSARVERAVSSLEGVDACSVNLLANSMTVEGNIPIENIIAAVENAGYGAEPKSAENGFAKGKNADKQKSFTLVLRLVSSVFILILLMYLSMGYTMWGFPLPSFLSESILAQGISQMLLSLVVLIINKRFFVSGFKGALKGAPNMDTLVSLGSLSAFVYSTAVLFSLREHSVHDLYFESAAMIVTLITVGKLLEEGAKGKTTNAIRSLMELAPKTATVIRDGKEAVIPADELKKGNVFVVKAGGSIPADAVILEGNCSVDESALTGESLPIEKGAGDRVSAATVTKTGYIKCRAERVGEDTTLSQIIKMVELAAASKAPIAKIADKVSAVFVPVVLVIAAITTIIWLLLDKEIGFALARGISVLVISCPCALGLATPVAIMVASGVGAKNAVLFKTAASLEAAGKTDIVVLDKTGTITEGRPDVTDIIADDEQALLEVAYALEYKSEHPLASAIVKYAEQKSVSLSDAENIEIASGRGISATINGKKAMGGNADFVEGISSELLEKGNSLSLDGKTPLYFCVEGNALGIIAVADKIKDDSQKAIARLKDLGLKVVMLTGDNQKTANAVGKAAGVDEIIAGVLPNEKQREVERFKAEGAVMMVGDGINDAPALTSADIGIAIGAGADIAIESADIVLVNSRLSDVVTAIRLSRKTLTNIRENLFWAFIYNVIGIPLAAGAFIGLLGWQLNPMFAAAAMSLSSFCVVTNALRLNFFKADGKNKTKKEKFKMTKTMKIEGMMCPHCSGRVKAALEGLDGIIGAEVSHESGTAVVTLSKEISNDALENLVEQNGYKVIEIK